LARPAALTTGILATESLSDFRHRETFQGQAGDLSNLAPHLRRNAFGTV
jgi:hypothetical protein